MKYSDVLALTVPGRNRYLDTEIGATGNRERS